MKRLFLCLASVSLIPDIVRPFPFKQGDNYKLKHVEICFSYDNNIQEAVADVYMLIETDVAKSRDFLYW